MYKEYINRFFLTWTVYFMYQWSCFTEYLTDIMNRISCTPLPLYVYKVVHFDDKYETDKTTDYFKGTLIEHNVLKPNDEEYEQVTNEMETIDESEIENENETKTLSKKYNGHRIEYRVTWNKYRKYRVVSTLSSPVQPRHEMFVGTGGLGSGPKIVCAMLKDDQGDCNVTQRVTKYAGPRCDFFNQKEFRMFWMFENDHLEEDTVLFVLLSNGKQYNFQSTDIISF